MLIYALDIMLYLTHIIFLMSSALHWENVRLSLQYLHLQVSGIIGYVEPSILLGDPNIYPA